MNIKVLHIGYGFIPWRGGGLIEYTEDLMSEQVKNGYQVAYFCSGRHYPIYTRPFLKKWKKNGYEIYEIINPPIYHGGDRGTLFDLESTVVEKMFTKVVGEFKPNIVHIQELAGLPSSLIEIVKKHNIPLVMTLHDYFLLCPTLKLFDHAQNDCMRENINNDCIFCVRITPTQNRKVLIKNTLIYELRMLSYLKPILKVFYEFLKEMLYISQHKKENFRIQPFSNFFQNRRNTNIKRLQKIDLLIAQSHKVKEIYEFFLKECEIVVLHSTVKHIEKIKPKTINPKKLIKFGTLNGMVSVPKGACLLYETIKILNRKGLNEKFELHIFGGILPDIKEKIKNHKNIFYHGPYKREELDRKLEIVDVGIIPSIWQEVFGYVGIEFLAKGIPIIGNNKGGIVDYTIDGLTGWINKTSTAQELAEIMENIIKNPEIIQKYNDIIINKRKQLIKTMYEHFCEIDKIYKEILKEKV